MLKYISIKKLINNKEEAPFGIPGARNEHDNYLRVKTIFVKDIGFLLEINR